MSKTGPFEEYTRCPHFTCSSTSLAARTLARRCSTQVRRQPERPATYSSGLAAGTDFFIILFAPSPSDRPLAFPHDHRDQEDRGNDEPQQETHHAVAWGKIARRAVDRAEVERQRGPALPADWQAPSPAKPFYCKPIVRLVLFHVRPCLLYTSDAADERSSVDLGGR